MNKFTRASLLAFLSCIITYSCKDGNEDTTAIANDASEKIPGIRMEFIDSTARPQDDFYQFVNGRWLDSNKIPEDRGSWGAGPELAKQAKVDMLNVLDKALETNKYGKGSDQYKALVIYKGALDTVARNNAGYKPIQPYLDEISSIESIKDVNELLVDWQPLNLSILYSFGVNPDLKNSTTNITYLGAGTTGLPERDFYLKNDQESKDIRDKYTSHVSRVFQMLGENGKKAEEKALDILELETKLAELNLTKEELRDARVVYNPMQLKELKNLAPSIDWSAFFSKAELKENDTIIVTQPKYIKGLEQIIEKSPISHIKSYMEWSLINRAASSLTTELDHANWDFYSKTLNGEKQQKPAKERALSVVNSTVGEAVGQIYVAEKFPPQAKATAERLVNNLIAAYRTRINNVEWMTKPTKEKALEKLNKLNVKIGYPDKWKDYSDIQITASEDGGSYFENLLSVVRYNFQDDLEKIGQAVDKSEWLMTPQTVNAYFYPLNNEIVFPAAILQPPYFNYQADMAVNYGGIGSIIGHEISHAFDDSGSRFDAEGNLNNWWTEEDLNAFKAKGEALISQFNELEPLPGVHVNGEFTLGENIGDLGGVNAAYDALQIDLEKNGNPGKIDGLNQDERFFIAWAAAWRQLIRDESLKNAIKTDPHSPGRYRAYMPLRNMDAFHETFNTKPGDSLYLPKEERIEIW